MKLRVVTLVCMSPVLGGCAATAPAVPSVPVAAAAGTPSVDWVSIADLMASPRSKAVLEKDLPGFCKNPRIRPAMAMTLQDISPFSGGVIDDAKLWQIQRDLNTAYSYPAPG